MKAPFAGGTGGPPVRTPHPKGDIEVCCPRQVYFSRIRLRATRTARAYVYAMGPRGAGGRFVCVFLVIMKLCRAVPRGS